MGKFLLRFLSFVLVSVVFVLAYVSYFGVLTDKFDVLIKSKANEVNQNVQLDFNKTKIHLNFKELNLAVKLQNPKIIIKNNEIILSKIDLFLPLKSFITSDFLLQKAEIAFFENDIKDLTKITNAFVPRIINKQIKKKFLKGRIEGEFVIPFNSDGSIGANYEIKAKVINADININNDLKINNMSTDIKYFSKSDNDKKINFLINEGKILNLDIQNSSIDIHLINDKKIIKSKIKTKGKSNYSEIKIISSLLGFKLNDIKNIEFTSDLETSVKLVLSNKFKISEKAISVNGKINSLNLEHKKIESAKKHLPFYSSKIVLKNTEIALGQANDLQISGLIKFKEKNKDIDESFENFSFNSKKISGDAFRINAKVNLNDITLNIPQLNYHKESDHKADLEIYADVSKNGYKIYNTSYLSGKTIINIFLLRLNKKLQPKSFTEIQVKTFSNNSKNNDFKIKYNKEKKQTIIDGELFDAEPLLKSLYKTKDRNTFSKDFSTELKVNFDKAITGSNDDVSNFSMIASIKEGTYNKLSLKGNFSANEIIEMSIYQVDQNKKTLQVISDRARPFIKNFNFIKGFEEGKLEYESTITKEVTNSNLLITDFKVSKVPALAQLLTLASLQGIADTLSGEGIRFDSFEMKSNSKSNVMNIEDALAMGPAVSILLNGYVDKGKVVSLRGTLVPATKLNAIIASIPVVGEILVGKKIGEGVVGVSFKMKGPPKNIKTTVNPIKTLTPRFIVRAVEKIKKKKKEEAK
mgnify:CR=1 FL=1